MTSFYEQVGKLIPDRSFIFLNYGSVETGPDVYKWVRPEDRQYKYQLTLVRNVLAGVRLDGKRVLEVGCGRGGNCYYLKQYTRARNIWGIDICDANMRFCRTQLRDSRVQFIQADAELLPFASESFDVVLNLESSHCYRHYKRFLDEVHRVLRPGGTFAYADLWSLPIFRYNWRRRERLLEQSQFFVKRCEDISEPVFQALDAPDGLGRMLAEVRRRGNSRFINRILRTTNALKSSLAAGQSSYRQWLLQK